uniref:Uncharacterized protein n=1 Tax=Lutzomyia longipalpis TaxID=7200 RepID=A0A1B0CUQ5_LUTLO
MSHNSIPDRWLNYTNVGRPIEGSPFIAFKTPLAEILWSHQGNSLDFSIQKEFL